MKITESWLMSIGFKRSNELVAHENRRQFERNGVYLRELDGGWLWNEYDAVYMTSQKHLLGLLAWLDNKDEQACLADRLTEAISEVTANCEVNAWVADLIAVAGEAAGHIRATEGFNLPKIMYDMAKATSEAGWAPEYEAK